MTTQTVAIAAQLILTSVIAMSIVGKVAHWGETMAWFQDLWPKLPPRAVALAVVATEALLISATLAIPRIGSALTATWLIVASAVLWRERQRIKSCGCFGRTQPLGPQTALRNALLVLIALIVTAMHARPTVTAVEETALPLAVTVAAGCLLFLLSEFALYTPEPL